MISPNSFVYMSGISDSDTKFGNSPGDNGYTLPPIVLCPFFVNLLFIVNLSTLTFITSFNWFKKSIWIL